MKNRKVKVLVITYHPWRSDISVGNTLDNIFSGMEDKLVFANVYIRDDKSNSHLVSKCFNISERELAISILSRKNVGKELYCIGDTAHKYEFSDSYNMARRLRWEVFLLFQDLISILGKWKSPELYRFVEEFDPDIIFGPLGRMPISNVLMTSLSKKCDIPLITYPWDDHYSLNKHNWNPIFWVRLFLERKYIRRCALQCEYLYTITTLMQQEYSKCFGKECKLLYKGYSFTEKNAKKVEKPIKIVYMGNIGAGRSGVLSHVVECINSINSKKNNIIYELYIYTLSPKSERLIKTLSKGNSKLMPVVPAANVIDTLKSADILLHVEPVSRKERLLFRLSFSTKIVDYFYSARCILAIGGDTATIKYLRENDAGIIVSDVSNTEHILTELAEKPELLSEYGNKAWQCGKRNHQIEDIQNRLYNDFNNIVTKNANK